MDGYKRLLYVTNKDLLNHNVVIREFNDLSDNEFLTFLYAANYWKSTISNRSISFHDRGYLFSIKQHFGFKLPKDDVKQGVNGYTYSFEVIRTYDWVNVENISVTRMGSNINPLIKNSLTEIAKKSPASKRSVGGG